MHAANGIYSQPKATKETLQEYIQTFTDLVFEANGTDPTAVTCQVTVILFIQHLFNKEIMKQVAGSKILRHAVTLANKTEIKLSNANQCTQPHENIVMDVQNQAQAVNQITNTNAAILNWKANLTCYGDKGDLDSKCLHINDIPQPSQPQLLLQQIRLTYHFCWHQIQHCHKLLQQKPLYPLNYDMSLWSNWIR